MNPLTDRPRGELLLDLLLGALRVRDDQLNALAGELLRRCGEAPVRRLLREAMNSKNRPVHRVRVLQAIRGIGLIHDLASHLDLFALAQDKNPDVRAAVAELLWDLSHPQADLAEEPGPAMLPFGEQLPCGNRRRAPGRAAATAQSTSP
jgi:hypothetical protein